MNKDNALRTIGLVIIVLPLIIFIKIDVNDSVSLILGLLVGIGLTLSSSGEDMKIFGKNVFKTKNTKQ